jgi:hypothetical protein
MIVKSYNLYNYCPKCSDRAHRSSAVERSTRVTHARAALAVIEPDSWHSGPASGRAERVLSVPGPHRRIDARDPEHPGPLTQPSQSPHDDVAASGVIPGHARAAGRGRSRSAAQAWSRRTYRVVHPESPIRLCSGQCRSRRIARARRTRSHHMDGVAQHGRAEDHPAGPPIVTRRDG